MRAILIDPHKRDVTEVTHNGDLHEIYTHIGASAFDVVNLGQGADGNRVSGFVDDEGIFRSNQAWFRIAGERFPFAGSMLILGTDDHGETVGLSSDISVEIVSKLAEWVSPEEAQAFSDAGGFDWSVSTGNSLDDPNATTTVIPVRIETYRDLYQDVFKEVDYQDVFKEVDYQDVFKEVGERALMVKF